MSGKLKITGKERRRHPQDQKDTLKAGFRRLYSTIEKEDNPSVLGMIFKVRHLVEVERYSKHREDPLDPGMRCS